MTTIFGQGSYCCLCFGELTLEGSTYDWNPDEPHWTLVDVCIPCRTGEIYWMIKKFASYGVNNDRH